MRKKRHSPFTRTLPQTLSSKQRRKNAEPALGPPPGLDAHHFQPQHPSRTRRDPFENTDPWARSIWNILDAEGAVEVEEEGSVIYVLSYYISHWNFRRQFHGRPLRLDGDFREWPDIIRQAWADFFDQQAAFELLIVTPQPPTPITQN